MGQLTQEQQEMVLKLLKFNSKLEECQEITLNGDTYTITSVDTFEDIYDISDEYNNDIRRFIEDNVEHNNLKFLDLAGIYIMKDENSEYEEDEFIPFIKLLDKRFSVKDGTIVLSN